MFSGGNLAVTGFHEVMKLNGTLTRKVFEANRAQHPIYLEESSPIPWMKDYLRPHGLVFELMPEPGILHENDIQANMAFWEWQLEWLMEECRDLFLREPQVRKSYAKLRLAQANLYDLRGLEQEAETAILQSIRLYPAGTESMQVAVDMFCRLREFDRAAQILADYAGHDPDNSLIPAYTELILDMRNKNEKRIELEEKLGRELSGNTALQLVSLYHEFGMTEEMEAMADLVLTLPRLDSAFYPELANRMRAFRNLEYTRKALMRWEEKDPQNPQPLIDLAVIAYTENDFAGMYQLLIRAIDLGGIQARVLIQNDVRFYDLLQSTNFRKSLGFAVSEDVENTLNLNFIPDP
jgi:hypothetical protein